MTVWILASVSESMLAPFAHLRLQALGQPVHQVLQLALLQHRGQAGFIQGAVQHDVVAQGAGEDKDILEDQPEEVAQAPELQGSDVFAVHRDATFAHIVEAHEQVDQGALAGPRVAHHGHAAALGDDAAELTHDLAAAFLVREGHPFQADLPGEGGGPGIGELGDLLAGAGDLQAATAAAERRLDRDR